MRKPRKPQSRCKCKHAKSRHNVKFNGIVCTDNACQFCFMDCPTFQQDNLKTLEALYNYEKEKEEYNTKKFPL